MRLLREYHRLQYSTLLPCWPAPSREGGGGGALPTSLVWSRTRRLRGAPLQSQGVPGGPGRAALAGEEAPHAARPPPAPPPATARAPRSRALPCPPPPLSRSLCLKNLPEEAGYVSFLH